jgi:hypothetical protein
VSIKVYLSVNAHACREGGDNKLKELQIPREHYDRARLQRVRSSPPGATLLASPRPDIGAELLSTRLTLPTSLVGLLATLEIEQPKEEN